jgi:dihydropteroate synthase
MTAPGKRQPEPVRVWRAAGLEVPLGSRPLVMGIVNVTPDSFSDGGQFATTEAAVARGLALAAEGADLLDIGGESTRPGAQPVPTEVELARVVPVVEALARQTSVPLSVDTYKAAVARECLHRGARIINDVTALADPEMAEVVKASAAGAILMHMPGTPLTMQQLAHYDDVIADLIHFFEGRLQALTAVGLQRERFILDPGIGFGKRTAHNLEILARLGELQQHFGLPICLGASRKGFLGKIVGGRDVGERLAGSLAVACFAALHGTAQIVRVHDVRATRDALEVIAAIERVRS